MSDKKVWVVRMCIG